MIAFFIGLITISINAGIRNNSLREEELRNENPLLKEFKLHKGSLDSKFIFSSIDDLKHPDFPDMQRVTFYKDSEIVQEDLSYLINWVKNIVDIPYTITIIHDSQDLNVVYEHNTEVSYCYPRIQELCSVLDPYKWNQKIGVINDYFMSPRYKFSFKAKKSNEEIRDDIIKLSFYGKNINVDDINSLFQNIRDLIIHNDDGKILFYFDFEDSISHQHISFQTRLYKHQYFKFEQARMDVCDIIEVCRGE